MDWSNVAASIHSDYELHVAHHNFHDVSNQTNSSFKHKIFCTHCSTDETFHNCRIINVGQGSAKYLYTEADGEHEFFAGNITSENESWFSWRITAPETKTYWREKHIENCEGTEALPATVTLTKSITTTNSATTEQKISLGVEATKVLKMSASVSFSWSNTNTKEYAEGSEVTIGTGKMVKPGWKWIVKQLVGSAAFAEISTDKYKSVDVKCNT